MFWHSFQLWFLLEGFSNLPVQFCSDLSSENTGFFSSMQRSTSSVTVTSTSVVSFPFQQWKAVTVSLHWELWAKHIFLSFMLNSMDELMGYNCIWTRALISSTPSGETKICASLLICFARITKQMSSKGLLEISCLTPCVLYSSVGCLCTIVSRVEGRVTSFDLLATPLFMQLRRFLTLFSTII